MAFAPIGPVVNKVVEKSVEFVPVIGPGLRYVKTSSSIFRSFTIKGFVSRV